MTGKASGTVWMTACGSAFVWRAKHDAQWFPALSTPTSARRTPVVAPLCQPTHTPCTPGTMSIQPLSIWASPGASGAGAASVAWHLVCSGHWTACMALCGVGCGWTRTSVEAVRTAKVGPCGAGARGGRGPAGGARAWGRWVRGG